MSKSIAALWQSLWTSHRQTKNALRGRPPEDTPPQAYSRSQIVGLLLGPLLFILVMLVFEPQGLSYEAKAVLGVTLWIATWWITEAIPIPATSLLPILLLPITGAVDNATVTSAYGDDIIFLFLGGFFIATAMEKWNLHKRMALAIIAYVGTSTQRILLGFMLATAFLSMWVSNTASVMMMVPMALAITAQVAHTLRGKPGEEDIPVFEKSLIFGVGYAGTIGGLGTLIGTPPNIILAAQARELFGVEISFAGWMLIGVPMVVALLVITWLYLGRVAFRMHIKSLPGGRQLIQQERDALGIISFEEKAVAAVFAFAAFMWISRGFIWADLVPEIRDGMIAVMAAVLLFVIPSRSEAGSRVLMWKDSKEIPWGILLLFGGGLAIAAGFRSTGLSDWMGSQLTILDGVHLMVMIATAALLILFLTEITSNTATATMILPVVASLALALNVHPFALMIPCAMAANCAFMLPVGTPPNAIIFATEKLRIVEMMQVGFLLNLIATVLITLMVYFGVPLLWGIDLTTVPAAFLQ
ncbi:SLC13 family permease [Pseudohongiella sp. SYSU M77423]|uniref:SLC13 family permease n=1 Tax=unclassified Pseudohongiella TaxID=2629611 RepID=UPI001F3B2E38|nr:MULTISPECIES: SLC13 family permease [unclassified Pseudohongiella]MDH7944652.1 SLC13 family permease [Pseudohongiella sp. SYSU M77423]